MLRSLSYLAVAACLCLSSSLHAQEAERLRVHGSNTLGDRLMPTLVSAWLSSIGYDQVRRVEVSGSLTEIHAVRDEQPLIVEIGKRGSGAGMQALIRGDSELAMLTRAPTAAEQAAGWQLGELTSPDQQFVIALNGAQLLVAQSNPVKALGMAQLRALLAGEVRDWTQLGGRGGEVHVLCGPAASGLADYLASRVAQGTPIKGCTSRFGTLAEAARAVASDAQAIALVELATPLPARTRALAVADGGIAVAPTPVNLRSEDYPLVQRYSVYGGQMMSALGRSLALYLISPAAQRVVAAQGLMAMTLPGEASDAAPTAGPPSYRDAVAGARRLPLSVRFNLRSVATMFEGGSAQDLDRLIAYMRLPQNRGRTLAVVGFANADPANKLYPTIASNDRADIIAGYLAQHGIVVQRARGLGASRPLVGEGDARARERNERVEIWML
ncbi:MAG TPA: substrate-binding domain-containing protein [Stenotrophomonas sp.]|nr:substrate-binding domain-containing protein [Stenotrophomonas sp.]